MSGIHSLYRGPAQKGYASGASAPARIDDTANTLKINVAGSGTTEQEILSTTPTPVNVTATTLTLAPATHGGRIVRINSLTGTAVTLPAATGSGVRYRVFIGTAPTSGSVTFAVASASDYMRGFAYTSQDAGGAGVTWATANTGTLATESDTITWNRTTTGIGSIGDCAEFEDMASAVWSVATNQNSNGTEATPFTAAV